MLKKLLIFERSKHLLVEMKCSVLASLEKVFYSFERLLMDAVSWARKLLKGEEDALLLLLYCYSISLGLEGISILIYQLKKFKMI